MCLFLLLQRQPWKFPGILGWRQPCFLEGEYYVSVHKVPRMGGRGERHTKSVVKRNESRQLATAECRLCRAASFIGTQTGGRFMLSNKPNWNCSARPCPQSSLAPGEPLARLEVCSYSWIWHLLPLSDSLFPTHELLPPNAHPFSANSVLAGAYVITLAFLPLNLASDGSPKVQGPKDK